MNLAHSAHRRGANVLTTSVQVIHTSLPTTRSCRARPSAVLAWWPAPVTRLLTLGRVRQESPRNRPIRIRLVRLSARPALRHQGTSAQVVVALFIYYLIKRICRTRATRSEVEFKGFRTRSEQVAPQATAVPLAVGLRRGPGLPQVVEGVLWSRHGVPCQESGAWWPMRAIGLAPA
jgi:hypothetical protein